MHMLGAKIGEFSVTQKGENGNITVNAVTDVNIKVLFSYRIKYIQETVYSEGVLQTAHVETFKNDKLNSNMWLKLRDNAYLLIIDSDTTIFEDRITYSGSLVYFNEPLGIPKIYKERTSETQPINAVEEHVYVIEDEKGRELNKYFYENGILKQAFMHHSLGTIELMLEKPEE